MGRRSHTTTVRSFVRRFEDLMISLPRLVTPLHPFFSRHESPFMRHYASLT